ncbi:outer membrane beta-barrel protein [Membranihabitans maritimus]|uniref:outer membrane beta-barrel protein n=1 Tax=Membranihabitans maritimus TaxID=2904244 RepID=UPI001F204AC0|nr:outer membrane beta-barrel protein [Membranihabitans maritimus]
MKTLNLTVLLTIIYTFSLQAQEATSLPFEMSGSVDLYYKYDFSGYEPEDGFGNIGTSFGAQNNSISIGMANLILQKTTGKASFVADLAFGPRGQSGSLLNGSDGNSFHIQNLYVSYALSEKVSLTGGFMGTFVGYEVISPVDNFNYSTSYLFTSGPFQNAGIKLEYEISDAFGLMVGLFNDWNVYQDFNGLNDFGAQLRISPVENWDAYFNLITGEFSGTEFDLTTTYQITDNFFVGLNAADYTAADSDAGFSGAALYLQVATAPWLDLGIRGELFKNKDFSDDGVDIEGERITALTISANLKAGPLTIIPEFRHDFSDQEIFYESASQPNDKAAQFLVAAVYSF